MTATAVSASGSAVRYVMTGILTATWILGGVLSVVFGLFDFSGWRSVAICIVLATSFPVAVMFWVTNIATPWWLPATNPSRLPSVVFVAYGDVAATAAFLCYRDPTTSLIASTVFGFLGAYAGGFTRLSVASGHMAFTSAVTVWLGALVVDAGTYSVGEIVPIVCLVLLSINGTVLTVWALTTHMKREIDSRHALGGRDPLTGLFNRRGLAYAFIDALNSDALHGDLPVLIADLDDFKQINDRYGHDMGDRVLQTFSARLQSVLASRALTARLGGEEFCAVLLDARADEAHRLAEELRRSANDTRDAAAVTVSIGIGWIPASTSISVDPEGALFDIGLRAADAALYEAKSHGRNRVEMAEPPNG